LGGREKKNLLGQENQQDENAPEERANLAPNYVIIATAELSI
jgi:hypothetical protein